MATDYWSAVIGGVNALGANNAKGNATDDYAKSNTRLNNFIDSWSKPVTAGGSANTTFANFQPVTYVAGSRPEMGFSNPPSYLATKPATMQVAQPAPAPTNSGTSWDYDPEVLAALQARLGSGITAKDAHYWTNQGGVDAVSKTFGSAPAPAPAPATVDWGAAQGGPVAGGSATTTVGGKGGPAQGSDRIQISTLTPQEREFFDYQYGATDGWGRKNADAWAIQGIDPYKDGITQTALNNIRNTMTSLQKGNEIRAQYNLGALPGEEMEMRWSPTGGWGGSSSAAAPAAGGALPLDATRAALLASIPGYTPTDADVTYWASHGGPAAVKAQFGKTTAPASSRPPVVDANGFTVGGGSSISGSRGGANPVGVGGSLNPGAQGDFYNPAIDIQGYTTEGVQDRAAQVYSSLVGGVDRAAALAASQGFAQALRSGLADSTASATISDELTRKFSDVYAKLSEDARKGALGEAQSNYDSYLKGINQAVGQNNSIAANNNSMNNAIISNDTSRMNAAQSVAAQMYGAQLSADTSRGNSILNALMTQAGADRTSLLNSQVANGAALNNLLANPAIRALGNAGINAVSRLFQANPALTEAQAVAELEKSLGIDVGYGEGGYNDTPIPTTGSDWDWNYDYYQPSLADATPESYWGY